MENQLLNLETYILRVHVNCHGCRKKVKKTLTKIEGVYSVNIDSEEQKVTVRGKVDSARLISKLLKLGKHAELLFPMPNPYRIEGPDHRGNNRRQQMQYHNPSLDASMDQLMFPSFHGGESDTTERWLQRYKNQLHGEEDWSSETDVSQFEEDHKLHGTHYDGSVRVASNRIRDFPGYLDQHYTPNQSPMMPDLPGYQRYHSNGSYMRTDPYSFRNINSRVPEGNVHRIHPRWGEQNMFSPHASSYRGY